MIGQGVYNVLPENDCPFEEHKNFIQAKFSDELQN
jgi:hypothetical protein